MAYIVSAHEHQASAGEANGDGFKQGYVDDFSFQALHGYFLFLVTTVRMIWEFF
jgi:hypothetical protein